MVILIYFFSFRLYRIRTELKVSPKLSVQVEVSLKKHQQSKYIYTYKM